jgi:hypothetical protein
VLLGLGGQGKTQMALEYCRIQKRVGSLRAILWVDSSSPDALRRGYRSIASRFQPQGSFKSDDEAIHFIIRYLSNWEYPWLIILDNLDRPDQMTNIPEFLPQSSIGHLIITSRHQDTQELGSTIPLDAMEEEEALKLLLGCVAPSEAAETLLPAAKTVIERLGYLPLAIDQARAYITVHQLPLDRFLLEYESRKVTVMKTTPAFSKYRRSQGSSEQQTTLSVFTTWEMSFEFLLASVEHPDDIRDVLQLLGSFHPRGISETLLSAYALEEDQVVTTPTSYFIKDGEWDHKLFEALVIQMKKLSLLQFTRLAIADGEISLTLHPLVAEWLVLKGGRLETNCVTKLSVCHVASYACTFSDLGSTSFPLQQQLLSHLDHVHSQMSLLIQYWHLLKIADLYSELGQLVAGEQIYNMVLARCERALGPEHTSTLDTVNNIGNCYADLGRLEEAEMMYKRALAGNEKALGLEHTSTLNTVNNLGNLYVDLGRLEEAEMMYKRALAGKEKALGLEHTSTLNTVNNLGTL